MSNKLDVDDLINWLNQSEDEAKATVAESGATADPFYDGVLSAIFQIREYIKKMRKIDDAEGKSEKQWISVREKLPKCGVPVAVLLQGQYPEDVEYEVARLTDLSDTERPGKYWYKRGCGYLQHPKYMDGVGNLAGYEVVAWLPLPMKREREVE